MVHSRNRNTRRQEITDAARTCLDPCNMRDRWLWCAINCCQIFAIHAGLVRDKAITTSNHVPTVASTTVGEVEIYHIDMSPNPSSSMSRRRERDTFTPPPRFASCSQTSHLNETARTEIPEPEPEGQKGVPTSLTVTRMLGPGDLMMQGLCKSYAILSARGTGETQVDPRGSKGLLANVLATVPRGEAYEVVYPASGNVLADPESGAADVIRHARAMLEKCPTQKMVYFGYSQGAMVITNALNDPGLRMTSPNVRAVVFYGNPYYRSGQPQDRGTATSGSGIGLLKNILEPASTVPAELVPFVSDFCNEGDPVCQGLARLKLSDIAVTLGAEGKAFAEHHYDGKPQETEAIAFVVRQLRMN